MKRCSGIIRRKCERNLSINNRLEKALIRGARMMTGEIERKSRIQKRGKYSCNEKNGVCIKVKGLMKASVANHGYHKSYF